MSLLSDLPQPPVALAVNKTGQWVDTIGVVVALAVIAVAAYRLAVRHRSVVPLVIPLGALVAGFMEPIYNVATNLWYMKPGQVTLLSSFDLKLPVWVLLSYGACYGGLGLWVWSMVERGVTQRRLWFTAGGFWVAFIALEICNLALGTYVYYGPQPFRIDKFPAWVSLANAAVCVAIGVTTALVGRYLPRSRQWLLGFAVPCVVAAGLFGTTFPEDVALHLNNPSRLLIYGAAIASTILALGMLSLVISIVPLRRAMPAQSPGIGGMRRSPALDHHNEKAGIDQPVAN